MTRRILQERGTSFILHSYKCEQRARKKVLFRGIRRLTLEKHLSAEHRSFCQPDMYSRTAVFISILLQNYIGGVSKGVRGDDNDEILRHH